MIVRDYKNINDILIFDEDIAEGHIEDYPQGGLDNLYQAEEFYFWFLARKEFLARRFQRYVLKNSSILEVGAGTGNVARYLMAQGYHQISAGDTDAKGLEYAKGYGVKALYKFDLLKPPFKDEFDVVNMFDVLEHIDDDGQALLSVYQMLKPDSGKIFLTVPAHAWLWNQSDRDARHKRRYTKGMLQEKLQKAGFVIGEVRYFFVLLTPLFLLRKLCSPDLRPETHRDSTSFAIKIHPALNKILLALCRFENRIIDVLPNMFGGSLFAYAYKKA